MTIAYLRSPSFSGSPSLDSSPPASPNPLLVGSNLGASTRRRWSTQSVDPDDIVVPNDNMEAGLSLRRHPVTSNSSALGDDDTSMPFLSRSMSETHNVGLGISRRPDTAHSSSGHSNRRSQLIFEQKLHEKRGASDFGASASWNGSGSAPVFGGGLTPRTRRSRPETAPPHQASPSPRTPESAPAFFDSARKEGSSPAGLRELTIGAAAAPASRRPSWIRRGGSEAQSDSSHSYPAPSPSRSSPSGASRRHSSFLGEYRNGQAIPIFTNTSFDIPPLGQAPKRLSEGDIMGQPQRSNSTRSSLPSPEESEELHAQNPGLSSSSEEGEAQTVEELETDHDFSTPRSSSEKAADAAERQVFLSRETDWSPKHAYVSAAPIAQPNVASGNAGVNGAGTATEPLDTSPSAADLGSQTKEAIASASSPAVTASHPNSLAAAVAAVASFQTSEKPTTSDELTPSSYGSVATSAADRLAVSPAKSDLLEVPSRRSYDRRNSQSESLPRCSADGELPGAPMRRGSASSAASGESTSTYRVKRKPVPLQQDDSASIVSWTTASASIKSPMSATFDMSASASSAPDTQPTSTTRTLASSNPVPLTSYDVSEDRASEPSEDPGSATTIPQVTKIDHKRTPSGSDFMRKAQEAAQARMEQMKAEKLWEAARKKDGLLSDVPPMRPPRRTRPSTAQAASHSELKAISLTNSISLGAINRDAASRNVPQTASTSNDKPNTLRIDGDRLRLANSRPSSRTNLKRPSTAPTGAAGQLRHVSNRDGVPAILEIEGQQFVFDDPATKPKELSVEKLPPPIPNAVVLNRAPSAKRLGERTSSLPTTERRASKASDKGASRRSSNKDGRNSSSALGWGLEDELNASDRAGGLAAKSPSRLGTTAIRASVDAKATKRSSSVQDRAKGGKDVAPASKCGSEAAPASSAVDGPPVGSYAIHPPSMLQLFEASQCLVYDEKGEQVVFGDLFQARRTLVCFLRHWWCGFCQQFAMSLKKVDPLPLKAANMDLIVVGQGDWQIMSAYRQVMDVPYRMYADPKRNIYRALGMTARTNDANPVCARPDYAQLGMTKGILVAIKKGLFDMPICHPGDMKLLGGDFILGPGLQCSFTHRMTTADGHMDVPRILAQAGCDLTLKSPKPPTTAAEAAARIATLAGGNRSTQTRSFGRSKQKKGRKNDAAPLAYNDGTVNTFSSLASVSSASGPLSAVGQNSGRGSRPSLWGRFPGSRLKSSRSQASLPAVDSAVDLAHTFSNGPVRDARSLSIMRKISYESRDQDTLDGGRQPSSESRRSAFYSNTERSQNTASLPRQQSSAAGRAQQLSPEPSSDALDTPRGRTTPRMPSLFDSGTSKTQLPHRAVVKSPSLPSLATDRYSALSTFSKPLSDRALGQTAILRAGSRPSTPLSNFQSQILLKQRESSVHLRSGPVEAPPRKVSLSDVNARKIASGVPAPAVPEDFEAGDAFRAQKSLPNGRTMPEAPESVKSLRSDSEIDQASKRSEETRTSGVGPLDPLAALPRDSVSSQISRKLSVENDRTMDSATTSGSFLMELDVYDSLSRQPSKQYYGDGLGEGDGYGSSFDTAPRSMMDEPEAADSDSDTEPAIARKAASPKSSESTPTMVWTPRIRSTNGGVGSKSAIPESSSSGSLGESGTASPVSSRNSNFASPSMGSLYGFGGYRHGHGLSAHLEEEEEEEEDL